MALEVQCPWSSAPYPFSLLSGFPKNLGGEALTQVDLNAVSQEDISTSTDLYMTSLYDELHQLRVLIRPSLLP